MDGKNGSNEILAMCYQQTEVPLDRFVLICGVGCPMAFLGVITNSILFRFFMDKKRRNSPYLYLGILAFLDILFCLNYILIFGGDAFSIYTQIGILWLVWTNYSVVLYGFCRMVELACPYIIIAATIERYILSTNAQSSARISKSLKVLTTNHSRRLIICAILALTLGVRGAVLATVTRLYNSHTNCSDSYFKSYDVGGTALMFSSLYQKIDVYVMPILQTFFPITLLCVLNVMIVRNLRSRYREFKEMRGKRGNHSPISPSDKLNGSSTPTTGNGNGLRISKGRKSLLANNHTSPRRNGNKNLQSTYANVPEEQSRLLDPTLQDPGTINNHLAQFATDIFNQKQKADKDLRDEKVRIRGATITLVAIVTSYLICSSFSLFLRVLEQLPDNGFLKTKIMYEGEWVEVETKFYSIAGDVCSLLVVLNCFVRIFIYLATIKDLRKAVGKCNC